MSGAFNLWARIWKKILSIFPGLLYRRLYTPTAVAGDSDAGGWTLREVVLEDCNHVVATVENATIFTDGMRNVSISVERRLIPEISWQYGQSSPCPPEKNEYLNGRIRPLGRPVFQQGRIVSLLTGGGGCANYYHWLFDVLPRLFLVEKAGLAKDGVKYLIPNDQFPFQRDTLKLLGIGVEEQISSLRRPHLRPELCVATSHPNENPERIPRWILEFLRDSFLPKAAEKPYSPFVYIARGDGESVRQLLNEEELLGTLEKVGFVPYVLSTLSFQEQIALFAQAKVIVGVHGAGFANLAFASPGAVVYEIFSQNYMPAMYRMVSEILQLEYHEICSTDYEMGKSVNNTSFRITSAEMEEIKLRTLRLEDCDVS